MDNWSIDDTLIFWCTISAIVGAIAIIVWRKLTCSGLFETYVSPTPRDHYDYGKQRIEGE